MYTYTYKHSDSSVTVKKFDEFFFHCNFFQISLFDLNEKERLTLFLGLNRGFCPCWTMIEECMWVTK